MNLNFGLNYPINKENNYIKKDLLNKNFTKIVSLILTTRPIALSNINYHNKFIHKVYTNKKGFSLKNNNLKKNKTSFISDNEKILNRELSKINIDHKEIPNTNICYDKINCKRKKNNISILNTRKCNDNCKFHEVPKNNTSYQKQKKLIINNHKTESVSKFIKNKSFSKSQYLNHSCGSVDIKKISKRKISSGRERSSKNKKNIKNLTINNKNKNNKFYLIKKRNNFSHDLKTKISLYIQQQQKYCQREYSNREKNYSFLTKKNNNLGKNTGNITCSYDSLKKVKKLKNNNIYSNITTKNSDKENLNLSSKNNNTTTTYCNTNNIHYYTTNFNNSTNITETTNELCNENKYSKEKKLSKKKIKLPFHPKSKVADPPNNLESQKLAIRSNKSEINIPYNRKNKICKMTRENSTHNLINMKNKKNGKINEHNTSREKSNSFIDSFINKNFINSSYTLQFRNRISVVRNDLYISSNTNNIKKDFCEGIEMNHFRIVSIIQENKRLLSQNEKCK